MSCTQEGAALGRSARPNRVSAGARECRGRVAAVSSRPTPPPEMLRRLHLPAVSAVSPPLPCAVGCGTRVSPLQGVLRAGSAPVQ